MVELTQSTETQAKSGPSPAIPWKSNREIRPCDQGFLDEEAGNYRWIHRSVQCPDQAPCASCSPEHTGGRRVPRGFESGSATSRYPLSREPCFLIGWQPNSRGGLSIDRQKPRFAPDSSLPKMMLEQVQISEAQHPILALGGKRCSAIGSVDRCPAKVTHLIVSGAPVFSILQSNTAPGLRRQLCLIQEGQRLPEIPGFRAKFNPLSLRRSAQALARV